MADDRERERLTALTELASAEAGLFKVIWEKFKEWARRLGRAVFGSRKTGQLASTPDPAGVFATEVWWDDQLDDLVPAVEEIWTDSYADAFHGDPEWRPDAQAAFRDAAGRARNRLRRVPASVYADVRGATMRAVTEGWSVDDLAERVHALLDESGAELWRSRALTIARTEALSAYNGGKYASFVTVARNSPAGPDGWEKIWLATHDHRTRFTHTRPGGGDLQRVGLLEPFTIGGAPMLYPGDPEGPPDETINCRCTILLVEPGEHVNLSDRQYRSAK